MLYDELVRHNRRVSRALIAGAVALTGVTVWAALLIVFGAAMLDPVRAAAAVTLGVTLGVLLVLLAIYRGPQFALRVSRARPARRETNPQLYRVFDEVCVQAGVAGTPPQLYVIDDPTPNAFATGTSRSQGHIAVTSGLVATLPRYELQAVLAHELAHIVNDDVRTATMVAAMAGVVGRSAAVLAASGQGRKGKAPTAAQLSPKVLLAAVVVVLFAPVVMEVLRHAVSRHRELLADATAVDITRDPQSLVNALRRVHRSRGKLTHVDASTAHLWFTSPFRVTGIFLERAMARWLSTHPPVSQRVGYLASLHGAQVDPAAPLRPAGHGDR